MLKSWKATQQLVDNVDHPLILDSSLSYTFLFFQELIMTFEFNWGTKQTVLHTNVYRKKESLRSIEFRSHSRKLWWEKKYNEKKKKAKWTSKQERKQWILEICVWVYAWENFLDLCIEKLLVYVVNPNFFYEMRTVCLAW